MIDGWVQWVGSAAARFTGGTGMAAWVHSGRVKELAGDKKKFAIGSAASQMNRRGRRNPSVWFHQTFDLTCGP